MDTPRVIHKDILFDFRLTGVGWAECCIVCGEKLLKFTASYLSDALGQLATAALLMHLGAPSARISFDEEPGEYRWGIEWYRSPSGDETSFRVRIWWFTELWGRRPDDEGEVKFDEIIDADAFYRAVRDLLDEVRTRYGEEGYNQQWDRYRFPRLVQQELKHLVGPWPSEQQTHDSSSQP